MKGWGRSFGEGGGGGLLISSTRSICCIKQSLSPSFRLFNFDRNAIIR